MDDWEAPGPVIWLLCFLMVMVVVVALIVNFT